MTILKEITNTLGDISTRRYFRTERGYQSEFYSVLSNHLAGKGIFR